MTTEIRLKGTDCNIDCGYCYQKQERLTNGKSKGYDMDKTLRMADEIGKPFNLFGGEVLLVPIKDLEYMFQHAHKKYGHCSLQTNGTLINDRHIELFKKYNVSVGVSIDGANDLNLLRRNGSIENTMKTTEKILNNIQRLTNNGISVSIIITLHRLNGTKDKLPRLINFIKWLTSLGIRYGNIHTLEVDKTMKDQEQYVLTPEENSWAFLELAKFFESEENKNIHWNPFSDYKKVLSAKDNSALCHWSFCDPMNTQAVYGIEGDGSLSNCGRTNKEGIGWYKDDNNSYERYISLYYTPDEFGGCQGCRFWITCGGSCPGEAINGDFRNKTIHCQTQKTLLTYYEDLLESKGISPITKSKFIKDIEAVILNNMISYGKATSVEYAYKFIYERTNVIKVKVVDEVGE